MFLRSNKRFKDGKEHRYWSVVENRRVTTGTVQKTVLYLGEINDSEKAAWTHAISALDESHQPRDLHLFPEDRAPDPLLDGHFIQLKLSQIQLSLPRQWGGCWLALQLWDQLRHPLWWRPFAQNNAKSGLANQNPSES